MKKDLRWEGKGTGEERGCGNGCRVQPGKISRFNFPISISMMPALQQIGAIEFLLLAA
jgi:hypothetical protein